MKRLSMPGIDGMSIIRCLPVGLLAMQKIVYRGTRGGGAFAPLRGDWVKGESYIRFMKLKGHVSGMMLSAATSILPQ